MAERIMVVGDTLLVRQLARGVTTCARKGCPRSQPGPTHVYWWSEDQCGDPPLDATAAYCSQECWAADQCGPAPMTRKREWAERFPPGEYDLKGQPNDPVRASEHQDGTVSAIAREQ